MGEGRCRGAGGVLPWGGGGPAHWGVGRLTKLSLGQAECEEASSLPQPPPGLSLPSGGEGRGVDLCHRLAGSTLSTRNPISGLAP